MVRLGLPGPGRRGAQAAGQEQPFLAQGPGKQDFRGRGGLSPQAAVLMVRVPSMAVVLVEVERARLLRLARAAVRFSVLGAVVSEVAARHRWAFLAMAASLAQ